MYINILILVIAVIVIASLDKKYRKLMSVLEMKNKHLVSNAQKNDEIFKAHQIGSDLLVREGESLREIIKTQLCLPINHNGRGIDVFVHSGIPQLSVELKDLVYALFLQTPMCHIKEVYISWDMQANSLKFNVTYQANILNNDEADDFNYGFLFSIAQYENDKEAYMHYLVNGIIEHPMNVYKNALLEINKITETANITIKNLVKLKN